MRVDVVVRCGTEEERLAQLPVLACFLPLVGSRTHVRVGECACVEMRHHQFALAVQCGSGIRECAIRGDDGAVHIRRHRGFQSGLFGGLYVLTAVVGRLTTYQRRTH